MIIMIVLIIKRSCDNLKCVYKSNLFVLEAVQVAIDKKCALPFFPSLSVFWKFFM